MKLVEDWSLFMNNYCFNKITQERWEHTSLIHSSVPSKIQSYQILSIFKYEAFK